MYVWEKNSLNIYLENKSVFKKKKLFWVIV